MEHTILPAAQVGSLFVCETAHEDNASGTKKMPIGKAIGTVLAHDITEIRPGEFKGRAFRKGHMIREEDVCIFKGSAKKISLC